MSSRFRTLREVLPPSYWTVWWGTLINRAGAFVVPILTFYLTRRVGLSLAAAGAIVALFGAGSIVASLVGGLCADRLGRKVTMVTSLSGGAILMAVLGFVTEPSVIAPVVLVLGFVGELYRPSVSAFVADVVPAEHRQSAYGFLYWAINIGFSIAPVAAGLVATVSYRALFFGDAATSALFAIVILVRVPESHPDLEQRHTATSFGDVLRDRTFMWAWGCMLLLSFVIYQSTTTLSGWMQAQGYGPGAYGIVLAVNGALIVLVQPMLTEWSKRHSLRAMMSASAVLTAIGFALHGGSYLWLHMTAVAVWTFGEILMAPSASTFVAERAPVLARGRYQGMFAMAYGIAGTLAPLLGPRLLAVSPSLLWGGCLVLGLLAALGFRAMKIQTGPGPMG